MTESIDIFSGVVLGSMESYDTAKDKLIVFKKTDDIVEGILCNYSNMAGGFPFEFAGRIWLSSEVLYLCGEFSEDNPRHLFIQKDILTAKSGYAAKRFKKSKYRQEVRTDFADFRLQWMLFVVWQKCLGCEAFGQKLLEVSEDTMFVENTTTDTWESAMIWGCSNKPVVEAREALAKEIEFSHPNLDKKSLARLVNIETNRVQFGLWTGQNNIGKILKICQLSLIHNTVPPIDYELLNSSDIHLLGDKLKFEI